MLCSSKVNGALLGIWFVDLSKAFFRTRPRLMTLMIQDVVLIPKSENPNTIKQFRPIALCNVVYKAITKIIANRLKPLLWDLISPTQCSFILGRHRSDNIIISQEIIHSMANKRGKKGFMAIKVDLEKAYDRLNWEFFMETLKNIGISDHMTNIIMRRVSRCRMRINWNREPTEFFSTSRGIH